MLKCLREKSSLELLSLGKVRRDGKICVGNSEDGSGQTLYLFYLFCLETLTREGLAIQGNVEV